MTDHDLRRCDSMEEGLRDDDRYATGTPARTGIDSGNAAGTDGDARAAWEVATATRWLLPRLVEVLRGHRPASQLADHLAPFPYADLLRRTRLLARAGDDPGRATLRSLRCQIVHRDIAEVAVHLQVRQRSVALALRWERHGRAWLCTVLDFGPDPFTRRAQAPGELSRSAGRR